MTRHFSIEDPFPIKEEEKVTVKQKWEKDVCFES